MAQTVIGKADELIKEVGHDKAITFFEDKIYETENDGTFQTLCNISGLRVALDYVKKDKLKL